MLTSISFFILALFLLIIENDSYDNICDAGPRYVSLDNGIETGIVSQSSSCYNGFTVVVQNTDDTKIIQIRFTMVPSNFQVQIYNGKIGDPLLQNCQIQNGSICYSTGSSVTFYFVPINAFGGGYNNFVELSVISSDSMNGSTQTFSFLTLIFFCFIFQTFKY